MNKATSTVTLTTSLNHSIFAQSVVFTATVAPQFGGSPTGTVTFKNGTTSLGTATLVCGVATLTTTTLVVGTASITAVYNGSTSFSGSTSSALSQVVNKANEHGHSDFLAESLNSCAIGWSLRRRWWRRSSAALLPVRSRSKMELLSLGTATLVSGVATLT